MNQTLVVGSFQCNCRILACEKTGHAVVVDPGDEPARILKVLSGAKTASGLPIEVKYLIHTHGHLDHIGATHAVRESIGRVAAAPKVALHRGDEPLYQQLRMQRELFGLPHDHDPPPVDHHFEDGEELRVGQLKFSVLHTPGHSPGSVCLRLHESAGEGIAESLFSGDTLFRGSVGRTDLWGGNQDLMFKSIRQRIFTLDDDTKVCPGHGPETSVGVEKRDNPFL